MELTRIHCVICENKELKSIYTLTNYPISPTSTRLEENTDEYKDCVFLSCVKCGCIQLKNLIAPEKLYANLHNSTENTPTWKNHHIEFASFIKSHDTNCVFLEIGGNSGVLYNILKDYVKDYTIMDLCRSPLLPKEITFIQGNCETYDIINTNSVIMSHTLEHLYNPRLLINNLNKSGVKYVFISIPNMDSLYNTKNMSIIHNEHTFFLGDNEIKYIFAQYGYKCLDSYDFRNHSRFYYFVYDNTSVSIPLIENTASSEGIPMLLKYYENKISDIIIQTPCYICPGGHYGQKIYYYLRKYKDYIKGFLDNDPTKQGQRVYGTSSFVYSPSELLKYNNTPVTIILYAGPYTEELKTQLNSIHLFITFISL